MNKPTRALVGLPIGGATSTLSHLPSLGPSMYAATIAEIVLINSYDFVENFHLIKNDLVNIKGYFLYLPEDPPTRCTPPLPAISTTPNCFKTPLAFQSQPAGMQYTIVFTRENKQ